MAVWRPGDPWPSPTKGGALSPHWGGYTKLWVRTAIAAGTPFHMGPNEDAGGGTVADAVIVEPFDDLTAWTTTAGVAPTITAGRTGTAAVFNSSGEIITPLPVAAESATVIVGYAFKLSVAPSAGSQMLWLWSDSNTIQHTGLRVDATRAVVAQRSSSIQIGISAAGVVPLNTWCYLEARFVLGDAPNGAVTVRINGTDVLALTGVDTRNGGTKAVYDRVHVHGTSSTVFSFDDLYVKTGAAATFAGDVTIGGGVAGAGPAGSDRLDAGNVMSNAAVVTRAGEPIDRLWVDVSCDVTDLTISAGASTSEGTLSKSDAATVTVTLSDPSGKYDPMNPGGPYSFGGRSRMQPGVPIEVFCEVVDGDSGAWSTHVLFTGTADSWQEDWTAHPQNRTAIFVATDPTKVWARYNRPEASPVGAGDTTQARIARIATYFGWTGGIVNPPGGSAVTLQATTLAQPGWELLNRTTDDELGYVHFTTTGQLRWLNRATWRNRPAPTVTLGCEVGYDVLLDATPAAMDRQMRNAVYAARTGGTTRTAISQSSIDTYGRYDYTRTDLGVATDDQAGEWATTLVEFYAFPQVALDDVTFRPSIAPEPWNAYQDVLAVDLISDLVRVVWTPPDLEYAPTVDSYSRVVGYSHTINRQAWEMRWQLVAAWSTVGSEVTFTMGPDTRAHLDAGFVLAA